MKCSTLVLAALLTGVGTVELASASGFSFRVVPFDFDPFNTHLVEAEWEDGIGCPSDATIRPFVEASPGNFVVGPPTPYSDPACKESSDPRDKRNFGLLLVKTGPTNNDASAGATLEGVRGITLTELGYDIRKPVDPFDPRGSHCGAGAPRFNVTTSDNVLHFVGCASPPPVQQPPPGNGWIRLRWTAAELALAFPPIAPGSTVKSISIVFDEGQDPSGAPDQFGAAILDNIDVNGVLVGRGPEERDEKDRDEGEGEDKDHRHFSSHSSASRPESSGMSFSDPSEGATVQMVNGARGVSYSGACVTSVGDALFNDEPGYTVSFAACDLSALATPLTPSIGSYAITVTGPSGVTYQKSGALTSGRVTLHPQ
jgi:hypothetical protein